MKRQKVHQKMEVHGACARDGFTLIEILFSLAIFALGFSVVTMTIPAGQIFQREAQGGIAGGIYAKNGIEVLKAQGLHDLTTQLMMTGHAMDPEPVSVMATRIAPRFVAALRRGDPVYSPNNNFGSWSSAYDSDPNVYVSRRTNWDMEGCVYCWQTTVNRRFDLNGDQWYPKQISGIQNLVPYLLMDPNNGHLWHRNPGSSGNNAGDMRPGRSFSEAYQDALVIVLYNMSKTTDLAFGKIHFLKNRPVPGVTPGCLSSLDFSFPSSAWDLSSRAVVVHPLFWNATQTYETGPDASIQAVRSPDWRVACVALGINSGAQWPELGDGNTPTNGYLLANEADAMRSVATNAAFGTTNWAVYRIGVSGSTLTTLALPIAYPATGGDPANPNLSFRSGGLAGATQTSVSGADQPAGRGRIGSPYAGPFNLAASKVQTYNYFPRSRVGVPVRDPSVTSADYQGYSIPPLVRAYALVYDYDQDKLLLRYPQAYAGKPDDPSSPPFVRRGDRADTLAGARLDEFWDMYPDADPRQGNWKDRKLQVGDWFLGSPGGTLFQVKVVFPIADEQAFARSVIGGEASLDWSDGTYQVVSVTPKLSDTKYTPNKPSILTFSRNTEKIDPPLYQVLVAPPPITGGNSPWQGYKALSANEAVFRNADNFAD